MANYSLVSEPPTLSESRMADIPKQSIYQDSVCEADRFKWIESEKAGRDLGERAIREWVRQHWWGYLRAKWLEHLQGKTFWVELDRGDFGLLSRNFTQHKELLDQIVELLKQGQENLGVLTWAKQHQQPIDAVILILEALDINSRRLVHRFDSIES